MTEISYWHIQDMIRESNADHWNRIGCWGMDTGPSYRSSQDGNQYHPEVAAFMPDPRLTIAWDMSLDGDDQDARKERQTLWSNEFPDGRLGAFFCDIFWCNALIDRVIYYTVDGGRYVVPDFDGRDDGPKVAKFWPYAVAWLIADLRDTTDGFLRAMDMIGIQKPPATLANAQHRQASAREEPN